MAYSNEVLIFTEVVHGTCKAPSSSGKLSLNMQNLEYMTRWLMKINGYWAIMLCMHQIEANGQPHATAASLLDKAPMKSND
jgi:hypothetical protein